MSFGSEDQFALYPLSNFDVSNIRSVFVTGWLVEGILDHQALRIALTNVTHKWRMLAARLDSAMQEDKSLLWRLKIPLGPLPEDYPTFSLTTSTSDVPLSYYVSEPIPLVSPSLPPSLFIHSNTPRNSYQHVEKDHPLMSFHLTFFHSNNDKTPPRTAIGFTRPHSVLDAYGASKVVTGIIAELNGREWDVPPSLRPGYSPNELQDYLDAEEAKPEMASLLERPLDLQPFAGYTDVGISGAFHALYYHVIKGVWWNEALRHIILLPKKALDYLVNGVRTELASEGIDTPRVSTGDILVAWVYKTIYSTDTSLRKKTHVSSFSAFRDLLPAEPPSLRTHLHNTFITAPYPLFTVASIHSHSLASLAHRMTSSRQLTPSAIKFAHVLSSSRAIRTGKVPGPYHPDADETLSVSNVSYSKMLDNDWGCISSIKDANTLCGYRYVLTATKFPFVNVLFMSGTLPSDGSTVLDVYMTKERMGLLKAEVERVVRLAEIESAKA
ncbi:hypothetical protein D9758_010152 [Tetrapyrgos nigripes]|uniref:Uncharacterized protein n=1 Tax=Tetrapyrgos nigripes TaxID=182062 RepID=A0A8H5FSC2_9AGAR|nr:hypothetical protein D9758_010152 [Tetrapyrgos nigripes]